tara:strand:- start:100 stop:594 length:495 start_codon:yes stop_codon:yes gene_type:complete
MFSKREILFWVLALIAGIILAWSCRLDATEVKEKVEVSDKYPNFLLYNSTTGCFNGIAQLMIMINPDLAKVPMPAGVQQQILAHCSCVMDKIRNKYTIHEYSQKMNDFLWIKELWGNFGIICTKEGYLAGLGIGSKDNKTIESTEQDSEEEEEPLTEDATQFQG